MSLRTGVCACVALLVALLSPPGAHAQGSDGDGDGLPDAWETQWGLDPSSGAGIDGASGDPDGDGVTNAAEFLGGTHPRGSTTRYFAEGSTGTFFDVRFAVFNSADAPARVLFRFLRSDGRVFTEALLLAPFSRQSVDPELLPDLRDAAFASVVEADQPVVVDRTMWWDDRHYGSHAETGVSAPSTTWYLAEGATHSGFQLFYLLQNPTSTPANVTIEYLRPRGLPLTSQYVVPPNSRSNIWVNKEDKTLASTDVSGVIRSDVPIVVERAVYKHTGGKYFGAGHVSAGVTQPATKWFLAEGATGAFFDLFVLVANPGTTSADVLTTYLLPNGSTVQKRYTVPGRSRFTAWVDYEDAALASTSVSVSVESTNNVPIIVERAMWWPGGPTQWVEAHGSPGTTITAPRWALAEGEVGGTDNTETFVLVANTGAAVAPVRLTVFYEDGGTDQRYVTVGAHSRYTMAVGYDIPASKQRRFSVLVESTGATPGALVVERAMYSDASGLHWAAGTNALGTPVGGTLLPLGTTSADSVAIQATDPLAMEGTSDTARFVLTRQNTTGLLTVVYQVSGSAGGADIRPLPGVATFVDGQASVSVDVIPTDDTQAELTETVVVQLVPGARYGLAGDGRATVLLTDNEPAPVPSTSDDVARFLTQATFGPTMAEIARVRSMGYDAWLNEQFALPPSSFLAYLDAITNQYVDEPHVQEAWVQYATTAPDQLRQRVANALLEIMVVSNKNGLQGASWAHAAYMDVLLNNAFGNYGTLLSAVTLNPGMGKFLDMLQNDGDPTAGTRPNENYAREVLQLFSVGEERLNLDGTPMLDPGGSPIPTYTQTEIEGFAHVFTGWTFAQAQTPYRFWPWKYDWRDPMIWIWAHHSPVSKTLLNGVVVPGGQMPDKDLRDALSNIVWHPNVGPFIARRLIQRLVTSNPSPAYIARVASAFNNNGAGVRGDMKAVVKAILLDADARNPQLAQSATYGKLREPMIRFITLLRAFNGRAPSGAYRVWDLDLDMGQGPFRAPSVFNFFDPDYRHSGLIADLGLRSPEFQITTESSVVVQNNTLRELVTRGYGWYTPDIVSLDLSAEEALAGTPDQLLDRLNQLLFAGNMSQTLRAIVKDAVNATPASNPAKRAETAVTILVNSPEFAVQK